MGVPPFKGVPPIKGKRLSRFILDPSCFGESTVELNSYASKHIRDVLRLTTGDQILVTDGHDRKYVCSISSISKNSVQAEIVEKITAVDSPLPSVTLAQAIPKGRKLDSVIRMACEIGVERIVPIISKRCVVKLNKENQTNKLERWREISVSSAQQSGADRPTLIVKPTRLVDLPGLVSADYSIVFWENESKSLKSVLSSMEGDKSILIFIGPEGGLEDEEVKNLQSSGFITASLGNKVLRTETAGIVALSALFYHFSE